jgi:hypothetical protein
VGRTSIPFVAAARATGIPNQSVRELTNLTACFLLSDFATFSHPWTSPKVGCRFCRIQVEQRHAHYGARVAFVHHGIAPVSPRTAQAGTQDVRLQDDHGEVPDHVPTRLRGPGLSQHTIVLGSIRARVWARIEPIRARVWGDDESLMTCSVGTFPQSNRV